MSDITPLHPVVTQVCEAHYGNVGSGCGKCPIQSECHALHQWSEVGLAKWRDDLAEAAKKVVAA